jgi:translocator assembly and maintenance protein 41
VKYGVTNIDTLSRDLKTWDTLYLAGRLQKPVQILRDDPSITLSYQANLIAATRTALLMLPERFTEYQLYSTITGISYLGDPRMSVGAENPNKIDNIVDNQLAHFRLLYGKVIEQLPNLSYEKGGGQEWSDRAQQTWLVQDMSPSKRANMVRRLPTSFREKLYFQYQRKFAIPALEFEKMVNLSEDDERVASKQGGEFEKRIVEGGTDEMADKVKKVIKSTISWPSTAQSLKGVLTAGPVRGAKYLTEKMGKWRRGGKAKVEEKTKEN